MAKDAKRNPLLLRWSDHVPLSDVQDPLGLGLRGSTRLASRLLFCITSITPRARYFSFIPWCVHDYQKSEKNQSYALGLADAIALREKALTLACIAHHDGAACEGGGVVGSRRAIAWFAKGNDAANFKRLNFAKVPALNAYFNSLVNLGFFVTEEELPDTDEDNEGHTFTFDDIELSPIGLDLAKQYDSLIGRLGAVRQLSERQRTCSVQSLAEWGNRGGLCELREPSAPDRPLLRDIFFARSGLKEESHAIRKQSLLLLLALCRQLGPQQWNLGEWEFCSAAYFGELVWEDDRLKVEWPQPLIDIATRWRMFQFHHFMSVALEGLLSWLVTQLEDRGLGGATIDNLVAGLDEPLVGKSLAEQFGHRAERSFGSQSPCEFFAQFDVPSGPLSAEISRSIDDHILAESSLAETRLEEMIRSNEFLYSPTGLACPMILLGLTLGRFFQWNETNFGKWLANAASDPYLDLIPPVLIHILNRRFGNWWECNWKELTSFVLSRFVVQQHQSMSYEKSATGDRCLLQVDGQSIISGASFQKIGMGNPRFGSAVQILYDLGLLEESSEGVSVLTPEGQSLLDEELRKEADS